MQNMTAPTQMVRDLTIEELVDEKAAEDFFWDAIKKYDQDKDMEQLSHSLDMLIEASERRETQ